MVSKWAGRCLLTHAGRRMESRRSRWCRPGGRRSPGGRRPRHVSCGRLLRPVEHGRQRGRPSPVSRRRHVAGTRPVILNNAITYPQAVLVGAVISVCTGVVYAGYNVITISYLYPNFLDEVVRARIAQGRATGSFAALRAQVSAAGIAIPNLVRLSVFGDGPFPRDVVVPQKEEVTCSIAAERGTVLSDEDRFAIETLHNEWLNAELRRDTSALLQLCTAAPVWLPPNEAPLCGRAAILRWLEEQAHATVRRIDIDHLAISGLGPFAWKLATFRTTVEGPADRTPKSSRGCMHGYYSAMMPARGGSPS